MNVKFFIIFANLLLWLVSIALMFRCFGWKGCVVGFIVLLANNLQLKILSWATKGEKIMAKVKVERCADDIIFDIKEVLCQCSEEFIAEIANKVLTDKVEYIGNGTFVQIQDRD